MDNLIPKEENKIGFRQAMVAVMSEKALSEKYGIKKGDKVLQIENSGQYNDGYLRAITVEKLTTNDYGEIIVIAEQYEGCYLSVTDVYTKKQIDALFEEDVKSE